MRKRYAPLNWPRRDPRHYRFAMPNKILEYKLKPVEVRDFFLSLLSQRSRSGGQTHSGSSCRRVLFKIVPNFCF